MRAGPLILVFGKFKYIKLDLTPLKIFTFLMASTVLLLGAGINRNLGSQNGLEVPLANDFFQILLSHPRLGEEKYTQQLKDLFDFVCTYYDRDITSLRDSKFDIEDLFTKIQNKFDEAIQSCSEDTDIIAKIYNCLTLAFIELLDEFISPAIQSPEFKKLAKYILEEKAVVLTMNWDTLLEAALEEVSGRGIRPPRSLYTRCFRLNQIVEEEVTHSMYRWNRALAYGVKFDYVRPPFIHEFPKMGYSGNLYFNSIGNQLYSCPLLKLHGSVNWFYWVKPSGSSWLRNVLVLNGENDRCFEQGQTFLNAYPRKGWYYNQNSYMGGDEWGFAPLLITPVRQKDYSVELIKFIWEQAREELRECKRLIVGGYSFPCTDTKIRELLRESFQDSPPHEVIVINPGESQVELLKDLCRFEQHVRVFKDLTEFINCYSFT